MAVSGVHCFVWLHHLLQAQPAACISPTARVQVTSGGLRQLLALPALAELTVFTFTDDLDDDWSSGEVYQQRHAALRAGVDELRALFALHGRSLIRSRR